MENEILSVASQLAMQGKKPSVALVRAKLSQRVPMPTLLQALKKFEQLSDAEKQAISQSTALQSVDSPSLKQQVKQLSDELTRVNQELAQLKLTVSALSTKLETIQ